MQYGTPEAQRAKGNTGFGPGDMRCDLTSVLVLDIALQELCSG